MVDFNIPNGKSYHPGFSVDCVIISYSQDKIRVILRKFLDHVWNLPGAFMFSDEINTDVTIKRMLKDLISIEHSFFRQFYLFSDIKRESLDIKTEQLNKADIENKDFYMQRFITLGYYAFVRYEDVKLPEGYGWFDLKNIPPLYSDHALIIQRAIKSIQIINNYIPIGYGILPSKFTITELRNIHEALHETKLDRRNFQRKILSTGVIIRLNERKEACKHQSPFLFQYNQSIIEKLLPFL